MRVTRQHIEIKAHGPANLFPLEEYLVHEKSSETDSYINHIFSVGSTGCLMFLSDSADKKLVTKEIMRLIPWREEHRHPGNAYAHLRSTFIGNELWFLGNGNIGEASIKPFLLENTAGRKRRPIIITTFEGSLMKTADLEIEANGWIDIVDISRQVESILPGDTEGVALISTRANHSGIITIEYEPALLLDTADFYASLLKGSSDSGRADLAALICPQSTAVPFKGGHMLNGIWQQIAFVDFGEAGTKKISVTLLMDS